MKSHLFVSLILAAAATATAAETSVSILLQPAGLLPTFQVTCPCPSAANNLRRANYYTRYVVNFPQPLSALQCQCSVVQATNYGRNSIEVVGAVFNTFIFTVDIHYPNEALGIVQATVDGEKLPLLQDNKLHHNILIRKDDQTFASCYIQSSPCRETNVYSIELKHTELLHNKWICRGAAGVLRIPNTPCDAAKSRVLVTENFVHLTSLVNPSEISYIAVDGVPSDYCMRAGRKSRKEDSERDILALASKQSNVMPHTYRTVDDDTEADEYDNATCEGNACEDNTEAEADEYDNTTCDGNACDGNACEGNTSTDSKLAAFDVAPQSCVMCRSALDVLQVPANSTIVPYLTRRMMHDALEDMHYSVQREVDADDTNKVVPGCEQCEKFLVSLGIPSSSPIVPHLNIDIILAALDDLNTASNSTTDRTSDDSEFDADTDSLESAGVPVGKTDGPLSAKPDAQPQHTAAKPTAMERVWPIFRIIPVFFHSYV